jgi:hypothetical protein
MKEEIIIETEVKNAEKSVKQLDAVADATKEAKDETEDYASELKDTANELEVFGVSLNGIKGALNQANQALKLSIKGLGGFKTALLATGIGAFVVLLGTLVSWLKSTKEGMEFLNKATAGLQAVVGTLTGVVVKLGTALSKLFTQSLVTTIKEMGGAFDGMTASMISAVATAVQLEDALARLQESQARGTVLLASNNQQISKNKRLAEDVTADINDRVKAQTEVIRLQIENQKINQQIADEELRIAQERIKEDKRQEGRAQATIEEMQLIAELSANAINVSGEAEEQRIESQNKFNELKAEQLRLDSLVADAQLEQHLEYRDFKQEEVSLNLKTEEQKTADRESHIKRRQAIEEENAEFIKEMNETNAEIEFQLRSDLLTSLAQLAGQDSLIGKSLAIADATINTWKAVTVALDAPTMVQRTLGVAYALTTGLNAVKQIQSVPIPKVQIEETPFGDGGIINGATHGEGGVWINAEGGEAIINRRAMAIPWIRQQASALNQYGGGNVFANGGIVPDTSAIRFNSLENALAQSRTVLVTEDLRAVQNKVFVSEAIATL